MTDGLIILLIFVSSFLTFLIGVLTGVYFTVRAKLWEKEAEKLAQECVRIRKDYKQNPFRVVED